MQLMLKILGGSNAGKIIEVNKSKFLIGRSDECQLRPQSEAISRRHCVIIKTDEAVGIRDLKSRNGTLVNGQKITGDKRLRSGDKIAVGPLEFEVVLTVPASEKAKTAVSKPSNDAESTGGELGGMVSQWLEEADDFAREEQQLTSSETREYRFDETSQIVTDPHVSKPSEKDKSSKDQAGQDEEDDKGTGKLPKFEVKKEQPKNTQEAASQVLRKLFNRG